YAVPTCPAGIEDCVEASNDTIVPRRVPRPPGLDVPLSVGAANSPNPFTSTSLMVTFAADPVDVNSTTASCAETAITRFKVEWDTNPSFNSAGNKPMSYDADLGTSPEVQDIDALDGSARYNITGLVQGTKYYVRVAALNTLGYGAPADYQDAVPTTSADAPGFPTTIAQLDEDETEPAFRGKSLRLSWSAPAVDEEYGDFFGDGGSEISAYLVEWSSSAFGGYEMSTSTVSVSCDGNDGTVNGTFRLMLNTS
ncbi:unnamed protein product, partial [Hapterophycus canaliculatus]